MIEVRAGDIFATKNPNGLGKAICFMEKIKSQDGEAEYGHTGIIETPQGDTLEAVWKISEQNLFEKYSGERVLIARWRGMDEVAFNKGFDTVKNLKGRIYPFLRLILHFLGIARWTHLTNTPVCSELTAMFLVNAGAPLYCGKNYWGITPDNLVDDWRLNDNIDVIFEGEL